MTDSNRECHFNDFRQRDARLRVVAQVTGTGVYDFEFTTGSNYWSPELKAIAGLPDDARELSLEQMIGIAHPEDRERFMEHVDASLDPSGDGRFEDEYRLVRPDGDLRWVRVRGRTFFSGQGDERRVLGASGLVIDVTERKRAEERLRASEEKYRTLFANMTEAFALGEPIFDGEGRPVDYRFLEANDAFYIQSGIPRGNLGRPVKEYVSVVEQSWVDCYAGVATTGQAIRFENYNAGTRRHYDVYAFSPSPGRFAILFWDITERKAVEAQIQALNAELESRVRERTAQLLESNDALLRSNVELRHFAHAMAHDLQTPLRSIAGFTQLLEREVRGRVDSRVEEWSAAVVGNTKRLQELIQEILAYTRLETLGLPFETTDLRRPFDEAVASLAALIGQTHAEVDCGPLPTLQVDRTQIAQVFHNLIENGIKYNRSQPPRVAVSCEFEEDQWVFSVADNGIGIDPRHYDRVFELFRRLHAYHEVPGTGIGVPLCRRIVERHGGRMWVESRPGEGSTFYFTLPGPDLPRR